MKIALLSPPVLSPFSPPLSILALSAYLRRAGIDVLPIDVSIEALHYNSAPSRLNEKLLLAKKVFDKGPRMLPFLKRYFEGIRDEMGNIEDVVQNIWNEEGFNLTREKFVSQINALNKAIIFSSLTHLPTVYSVNHIEMNPTQQESHNPFLGYYRNVLIPRLEEFQPDLIGISYNYETQIPAGLSLASEIAKKMSKPIVTGGSWFSNICRIIGGQREGSMSVATDESKKIGLFLKPFGIYGEGEETLLQLCRCIEKNESFSHIPGLAYSDPENGSFVLNRASEPLEGKNLPVIDLEGMPVGQKYLTPVRIAPLMTSRGCYWNRCAFCDHAATLDNAWRQIPADTVIDNLRLYSDKYGIEMVSFCDEAMSPSMLMSLSERITNDGLNIRFGTMMRFEKRLMSIIEQASRAGCAFLSFGLESGSPRIVSLMEKGYEHDTAQRIIDKCAENGIAVEVFAMFGFPSETYQEAQETISFIERNIEKLSFLRAQPWILAPGSKVHKEMERYGVCAGPNGYVTYSPKSYSVKNGLTFQQASEIAAKVHRSPTIGAKVVKHGHEDFSEEYFIIKDWVAKTPHC
jgi:radical SAM superfamily enzyme YgiQ (UPF0313 family)